METYNYPQIFSNKVAKGTSGIVFLFLGVINLLACYALCSQIFPSQIGAPSIVFSLLLASAIVAAVCTWIIPTSTKLYRLLDLPEVIENDSQKINVGWTLAIPAAIMSVLPTIATVGILYLVQNIDIFPAVYLTIITIPVGFTVMWILMNSLQVRYAFGIFLNPKVIGFLLGAFGGVLLILLYIVYSLISGLQTSLYLLRIYSLQYWVLLTQAIPVINLPDAGYLITVSGFIIVAYIITGLLTYIIYTRTIIQPSTSQAQIIVMEVAKPLKWKWEELKTAFSELKGEIWASLPYLNKDSLEMFRRIPKESDVKIITGIIRDRKEFIEGIEKLNSEGRRIKIRRLFVEYDKGKESPVFHDRLILAENMLVFLGTDIMKDSMKKEFFITKVPSLLISESSKIKGLLRHYWEIKDYELKEEYGEKARKETIKPQKQKREISGNFR